MTYGNLTGVIKSPISRPYWIDTDSSGRLVFNEQTSNSIAVMDPKIESLVEYSIPSRNPSWGDCGDVSNCGIAQVFDFAIDGDKIWFTEWVENNIGVVDTSVALPLDVELESDTILMKAGSSDTLNFSIHPKLEQDIPNVNLILSDAHSFLDVTSDSPEQFSLNSSDSKSIDVTISANNEAVPGSYKILLGAQTEYVSFSKFVTLTIEP